METKNASWSTMALVVAVGLTTPACAGDTVRPMEGETDLSAGVTGTGPSEDADDTAATAGEGDAETETGADDGVMLDVANTDGTAEGGAAEGCNKVDVLFVIDNSSSMEEFQANLIASFPGFVDGMQTALTEVDSYHVGVVTTDTYPHLPPTCERLGTLVTQNVEAGEASSQADCAPYASGARYMTEDDDLAAKFACAAKVGTEGSLQESQVGAAIAATLPEMIEEGGCNEGFIRDDALLIVVVITDESEHAPGQPGDWFESFAAVKNGIESNVVMLTIVELDSADHILLTQLFTNGAVGNIYEPTYDEFFVDAISGVEVACDGFIPPG